MQIQMTGQGMSISPALRELTEKKLQRLVSHVEQIERIQVTFHVEKIRQIAHAHVTVPGTVIDASAESDDMYATVDKLVRKLASQLSTYKSRN